MLCTHPQLISCAAWGIQGELLPWTQQEGLAEFSLLLQGGAFGQ